MAPVSAPALPFNWLRLAYAFEFLLALLTTTVLWQEIGGQAHMDLIPWYLKALCLFGMAASAIRYTAALLRDADAWSRPARFWFSAVVFFGLLMGSITLYVHLHEVPADADSDETSATSVSNRIPQPVHPA